MNLTLNASSGPISRVIGCCSTDSRVAQYGNEAQARLLPKGKWVGSYQLYKICVTNENCVTWPRQVETIETYAICECPGTIFNQWFEFLANGPGILKNTDGCGKSLIDAGEGFVTFQDIVPKGKKIRVLADVSEAATARILLQGYDDNNKWIQTQDSGAWIDGEYVAITSVGATSVNNFSALVRVIKPLTNSNVRLFDFNPVDGMLIPIAVYEWDETLPSYRRSKIPGMANAASCCSTDNCNSKSLHAMVKLRHIPVSRPNDFFVLGNVGALKLMVQAILKEERNLFAEARAYEKQAVQILQEELESNLGDGVVNRIRYEDKALWGGGGVVSWI